MRTFAACTLVALAALLAGCGDSHDAAFDDMLDAMDDLAGVLGGVTDAASAEAAEGRVTAIGKRIEDIQRRVKDLGEMDEAQSKALKQKYEARMMAAKDVLEGHLERILSNPEISGALGDALSSVRGF